MAADPQREDFEKWAINSGMAYRSELFDRSLIWETLDQEWVAWAAWQASRETLIEGMTPVAWANPQDLETAKTFFGALVLDVRTSPLEPYNTALAPIPRK